MGTSGFPQRLVVPLMIAVYGLLLFGLRIVSLDGTDVDGDILLASFSCIGSVVTWSIDVG